MIGDCSGSPGVPDGAVTPEVELAERHSGDFFENPLLEADVIIMGHILHEWNLEQIPGLVEQSAAAAQLVIHVLPLVPVVLGPVSRARVVPAIMAILAAIHAVLSAVNPASHAGRKE
jgi:hypothetical protein